MDDELYPFESRFVEIDGNVVHYVDEGSGPFGDKELQGWEARPRP